MSAELRNISFQYWILRNGAEFGQVFPIEGTAPVVRMDDSGEIKTSFSATFAKPEINVDWLSDEIRPELVIDGVRHPLGIYRATTMTPSENATTESLRIEAFDRGWMARDSKLEGLQYFAAGTNYVQAAASMLVASGIGTISSKPSSSTLPEARESWSIGTSRLSIANELLQEINYKDVWFDGDGLARIEPFEQISATNIRHTLDGKNIESLLLPSISRETDIYSAPNVFVVLCSNPDKPAGMVAIAENSSAQSPLSITSRGRRIVRVTQVNNIASQADLQAMADRQLTDSLISGETIQVQTGLLPGFGVGEVTALNYKDIFALCRERAWSMTLTAGGTMTHTLERQVLQIG